MKNSKRQRNVLEKTQEIIDRRKSALRELGETEENERKIQKAAEKVFNRWNKVFTQLPKRNETDK